MPIPHAMRRVNKVALNKVTTAVAPWFPGLGVVVHHGRVSGKRYFTPVSVFPRPGDRYVLALTYGTDTDWVKNVVAAGGCVLLTGGTHIKLDGPRLFHDEARLEIRELERTFLGLLHVYDFLELHARPDL
jgi:deazaflavin-dependent oxidoreductase (nitroreductase family)